jgi:tRNA pseudouridine55 synthase
VNQATKLSDYLLNADKSYVVKMRLFQATTTGDREGEITENQQPFSLDPAILTAVIEKYQNYSYQQLPPLYSAIKIKGKKLYEYARKNEDVVIEPRMVTIHSLTLLKQEPLNLTFKVHCSKGTYIRSLVEDIARDLKTFGHVETLERTSSGDFTLAMSKV